jgi:acetyltransferase-like isoleucine patch superfamily enzyme
MDRIIEVDDPRFKSLEAPFLTCAFDPIRRVELGDIAVGLGLIMAEALIDPTVIFASSFRIDKGSFVNAGVVIGAMSFIGKSVLVNRAVSLGHHTFICDNVSIGPGATLAGNIRVGSGSIIGAGSTVLPNTRIGENVIVAAGSLVRKEVPDNTFVAGNPAIEKKFDPTKTSFRVTGEE